MADATDPAFNPAVSTCRPLVCGGAPRLIGRLDQGFLPPLENLSTILINALSDAKHSLILVFDDYHFIENTAIDQALIFLFAKRG
jgi:ATP/maltotriose-dependent transcriptional regulator MalT